MGVVHGVWRVYWYVSGWFLFPWLWRRGAWGKAGAVTAGFLYLTALLALVASRSAGTKTAVGSTHPRKTATRSRQVPSRSLRVPRAKLPTRAIARPTTRPTFQRTHLDPNTGKVERGTPRAQDLSGKVEAGAPAIKELAHTYQSAMAQESIGLNDIDRANLEPGHGHITVPLLQDAYQHFADATSIALNGPPSESPFDDVGARLSDAFVDEQIVTQDMQGNYGDHDLTADYQKIQNDHQRLLTIGSEIRQHGG